ncbi:MAG TPA: hypothetical protein VLJ21_00795 [Candidatus Binatia bacterium]|nr:hypothetical protein [Candidatus Binatia bacterium]
MTDEDTRDESLDTQVERAVNSHADFVKGLSPAHIALLIVRARSAQGDWSEVRKKVPMGMRDALIDLITYEHMHKVNLWQYVTKDDLQRAPMRYRVS